MNNSLENMGNDDSYVSTGPDWAQASMAPFALFKGYTTEGGTRSPVIVAGPGLNGGGISGEFGDVKDIVPTILEVTDTDARTPAGKAAPRGTSLVDRLSDPEPEFDGPDKPNVLEVIGGRAVHHRDWKALLVTSYSGAGLPVEKVATRKWQLFNITDDPGETTDVSAANPRVMARMIHAYDAWAQEVGAVGLAGMLDPIPAAP